MGPEVISAVARRYGEVLDRHGYVAVQNPDAKSMVERLRHARWMCAQVVNAVDLTVANGKGGERAFDDAVRILGFIHGVLFSHDILTAGNEEVR